MINNQKMPPLIKVTATVALIIATLIVAFFSLVYTSTITFKHNMYTCGECRAFRATKYILGAKCTDIVTATEYSEWYSSQIKINHNHEWVLCPLITYRDVYGKGLRSTSLSTGETFWSFTIDQHMDYISRADDQDRVHRLSMVEKLYKFTMSGNEEEARAILSKIRSEMNKGIK